MSRSTASLGIMGFKCGDEILKKTMVVFNQQYFKNDLVKNMSLHDSQGHICNFGTFLS